MAGNKGVFAGMVVPHAGGNETPEAAPASLVGRRGAGILGDRQSALHEVASGTRVENEKKLVDPAVCIMWERHNRDYEALSLEKCSDLIESMRAVRGQKMPAIVRRVKNRPGIEYEVIAGARRHWSVSWLRANGFSEIKFLIEIRHLSDTEAFELSDLENRDRLDLTPYERAMDYASAVELYYGGNQTRMAERLGVNKSYISRYLDLARLPRELFDAFGSPHEISSEKMARDVSGLWKAEELRETLLPVVHALIEEQKARREKGQPYIVGRDVLVRLKAVIKPPSPTPESPTEVKSKAGRPMLKLETDKKGGFKIIGLPNSGASRREIIAAIEQLLAEIPNEEENDLE